MPNFQVRFRSVPSDVVGGLILDLDGDDLEGLGDGNPIPEWPNRVLTKPDAVQGTGAAQPAVFLDGSLWSANFGSGDYMEFLADLQTTNSDYTMMFVFDPVNGFPSTNEFLLNDQAGTFGAIHLDGGGGPAYEDGGGTHSSGVAAVNTRQVLSFYLGGGGGTIHRNREFLSAAAYTQDNLLNGTKLAANSAGAQNMQGRLYKAMIWNRLLPVEEFDFVYQGLLTKYGIAAATSMTQTFAPFEVAEWIDPPTATKPSRINPKDNSPHLYMTADQETYVQISAVVNGVDAPPDSSLGGDLFECWVAEYPGGIGAPAVVQSIGYSSVASIHLETRGHYTVVMRRQGGGGATVLHVEARET